MEFIALDSNELINVDGGVTWEKFWTGAGVTSGAIELAITTGKVVATAATVTAAGGLAAGLGIVALGAVAAGGTAYAVKALKN